MDVFGRLAWRKNGIAEKRADNRIADCGRDFFACSLCHPSKSLCVRLQKRRAEMYVNNSVLFDYKKAGATYYEQHVSQPTFFF